MHLIIQLFFRLLGTAVVPLGWKLLRGLGFGAVTFTGIQFMLDDAKAYVFQQLLSVPSEWIALIGLFKLDVCFNMLFSAYVARAVLWGMDRASGSKSVIRFGGAS
ncbi:DUF2523 domain-containing protein [Stutzerimonas stutzeri]|uniref:DUF2523 domain-containing protein n=1 Tax=Stutzerimonas stutzeri TaxID=316 RepID=UPI0037114F76